MEKSFVTLERKICEVCGKEYDTGALLLDKKMRECFKKYTLTGLGLCNECKEMAIDRIALVEISNGETLEKQTLRQEEAIRTGKIAWLKRKVAKEMFGINEKKLPMVFVSQELMNILEEKARA